MPRFNITCEFCQREVSVYRSPSARNPRFCSVQCTGKAQEGSGNPAYSGGRHVMANGYVVTLLPSHPESDIRGYVYEHRLAAERTTGRRLPEGSVVHHKNGIKTDNDIGNLEIISSQAEHMREHWGENPLVAPKGERHGMAKLSDALVAEIRDRHKCGEAGKSLATQYGVSRSQISNIVNGRQRRGN